MKTWMRSYLLVDCSTLLLVDCSTLLLVHSGTLLFLNCVALLFLNCVVLCVANLRTNKMMRRKGMTGTQMRRISYLLIHSVALLLVDSLVGGLTLVFIDGVAHLIRTFLGKIFGANYRREDN